MASAPAVEPTGVSDSAGPEGPVGGRSGDGFVVRRIKALVDLWRRSLRFRVVTSTLLLGVVVVSIISLTMYRSIADGLVDNRISLAQAESRKLTDDAQAGFNGWTGTPELPVFTNSLVNRTLKAPAGDNSRYVIFTRGGNNTSDMRIPSEESEAVTLESIPTSLRDAVAADPARQQTVTIELNRQVTEGVGAEFPGSVSESVPAVVVGSQVEIPSAGPYDIYFIYPMDQEQATLGTISRSFTLGALFLIALVSAIAYIVTSMIVTPVRRAAAAAERLSSGHLNERMSARGHDDLALLGQSFNDMADNLQTQIRQLEGLSRVQQRFVSDVSHELRTPLTTIRMAADLLHSSRDEMDPVAGRSAELLHDELDRFEELLADLLEISRYDAGAAVLEQDPVDLFAIVDRVVSSTESIADARGSDVTVHREPGQTAVAEVDARRIERVLRNLVVNAIEHGEGRPVDIWVGGDDQACAVLVEDHGVGLRAGEASLVFNRFWRADPARTRTTGGSGLGLAIALEDARLHHGWLQAWGEPGEGSRFRLTVPRTAGGPLTASPLPLTPREGDLPGSPDESSR
ncbi:MtrAB system histidine kinase MtrB [Janibacter terrae]|uniref:MtrAB system histidine kinase MtrB n=1 Tax=Janibacter TaxID=53457 RepID=UPI0009ED47F0|nr:MtrAB system histidine kinase MtrB [Janibacter terrae]MBA4083526.1 sensor histidine kinase [Kytococcus sp.]HBO54346.1 sensor histidine kinase [Janibacter terrae]